MRCNAAGREYVASVRDASWPQQWPAAPWGRSGRAGGRCLPPEGAAQLPTSPPMPLEKVTPLEEEYRTGQAFCKPPQELETERLRRLLTEIGAIAARRSGGEPLVPGQERKLAREPELRAERASRAMGAATAADPHRSAAAAASTRLAVAAADPAGAPSVEIPRDQGEPAGGGLGSTGTQRRPVCPGTGAA